MVFLLVLCLFCLTTSVTGEDRLKKIEQRLSVLELENAELEHKVKQLQQITPTEFLGFSASLNNDINSSLAASVVEFNNVLINLGTTGSNIGYNPANGIFTCPFTGTYFSSLNIITTSDKDYHASLIHASTSVKGRVLAQAGRTTGGDRLTGVATASESLLIRCSQGQNMRIEAGGKCTVGDECGLSKSSRWTVFWIHSG